jgi:putative transposase
MSSPRYLWRQLTQPQRKDLLQWRIKRGYPWHSPQHRPNFGHLNFLISASCYEHKPHIGHSIERIEQFSTDLLETLSAHSSRVIAWCVLPNHYHALVEAPTIQDLLKTVGQFHGKTSYNWNREENTRGRKTFFRCTERFMRSERHFWATLNYVHHNPVHHQYIERWTDWPWSSAGEYLKQIGHPEATRIWREYPIDDYGKKWDPTDL